MTDGQMPHLGGLTREYDCPAAKCQEMTDGQVLLDAVFLAVFAGLDHLDSPLRYGFVLRP